MSEAIGGWVQRTWSVSLVVLGALGFAPAITQAQVGAATSASLPSTLTVGRSAVPASITLTNLNEGAESATENRVCNAGDASPCEEGIVLVPACSRFDFNTLCTAPGAQPGVLAPSSATAVGRLGTACASMVFDVDDSDPTFGTMRFTPREGAHVTLTGSGSSCVIDFQIDVLRAPMSDQDPGTPGTQTGQATQHLQCTNTCGPVSLTATARGASVTTIVGAGPAGGSVRGIVRSEADVALPGSLVEACPTPRNGQSCLVTRAGSREPTATVVSDPGAYSFAGLVPGDYLVTGYPAANDSVHTQATIGPLEVLEGQTVSRDVVLGSVQTTTSGSSVDSQIATTPDGVPVVYWTDPLRLRTTACAAGAVHDTVTVDGQVVREGDMTRGAPTGTPPDEQASYTTTEAALYPLHGTATITFAISGCPGPDSVSFTIYIDPSGRVVSRRDGLPIAGATVRLLRSDSSAGPFDLVADGSDVMSPGNRRNPDTTVANGSFGWDVIAGQYLVHAYKAGCVATPANQPGAYPGTDVGDDPEGGLYATTPILQIPPPALNLEIRLDCGGPRSSASQTALAFPETAVGATSAPQTFDVENTGAERLHLQLPLATSTGSASDFAVSSDCAAAIEPRATCTATVRFAPRVATEAARTSRIALDGDGDGSAPAVALSASTPAGASVTPPPRPGAGTPRQPGAKTAFKSGLVKSITVVGSKGIVTLRPQLAVVGRARLCRVSLTKVRSASSAAPAELVASKAKAVLTRTVTFAKGKATVKLKLGRAMLKRLRRARARGLRSVVIVRALDASGRPLASITRPTRLRLATFHQPR